MNPDDPKFTAHALGEFDDLTPAERAEIVALLASDPAAAAEAQETQSLAARLRAELPGEAAAALDEAQRAVVLEVATAPAHRKLLRFPRPATILWALAACLMVFVSLGLLFPAINVVKEAPKGLIHARRGAIIVDHDLTVNESRRHEQDLVVENPSSLVMEEVLAALSDPTGREERAKGLADRLATMTPAAPAAPPAEGLVSLPAVESQKTDSPSLTLTPAAGGPITIAPSTGAELTTTNLPTSSPSSTVGEMLPVPAPVVKLMPMDRLAAATPVPAALGARMGAISEYAAERGREKMATREAESPRTRTTSAAIAVNGGVIVDGGRLAGVAGEPVDGSDGLKRRDNLEVAPTPAPVDREAFDAITDHPFLAARENPLSTFSIDVDTASYAIVRRFLNDNQRPPAGSVRIEELLNYFTYHYPQPQGDAPFSATMEVAACPWTTEHRLVRIGLKGREIAKDKRPASNLVFLIDVSGSMRPANKLPLLKQSLALLIDQLGAEDQVGIVVYAGSSGTVLEPTREKGRMHAALHQLEAGGSTNGASGLQLAYELAQKHFIKDGTNRVILATDGDWNVGTTTQSDLLGLIAERAKSGVFLTVLGLGMGNLNDSMMVKLAGRGNGNYAYLDTLAEAKKVLVEQLSGTLVTIAKDVKIQVEFNPAQVGAYRLIGYEKRLLAKEDFNDDKKDAGEIGAGHTVTALYEVVPAGKELAMLVPPVDALKYQPVPDAPVVSLPRPAAQPASPAPASTEMLTLKLRYKEPAGDTSKLLEFPLSDSGKPWEQSSRDFRFAAAVAGYGMLLRESPHKGQATWGSVAEWAAEGQGSDATGYRAEFLTLIEKAEALGR